MKRPPRILLLDGDITQQSVDAIVNAANTTLLGGGGVDGAIHKAAGARLLAECRTLGGCPTGEARLTKGYRLRAKCVIHTVGPVWCDGQHGEDAMLAQCYRSCYALALEHGLQTIAFPAISTGAFGFPADRAARIAVYETAHVLRRHSAIKQVVFVCFGSHSLSCYRAALAELLNGSSAATSGR